jgi:HAD superfamily hydrolase (TIGR01509 family)
VDVRGLIFDFDGLILDTEVPIFQSWQELYQANGCTLDLSTWAQVIGTHEGNLDLLEQLERQSGVALDRSAVAPRRRARELELIAGQPVAPGVEAYLESARQLGLKIGLASSSSCRWVTGHLERLGLLAYFDCIRAADDVRATKPDPEVYLAVLAGLALSPERAIALEDSPNGVLAARRAGIYCVAVPNALTRQLPLDQADRLLGSLADLPLPDLLASLNHAPPPLASARRPG